MDRSATPITCVLGRQRVLEAASDPRRRTVVMDGALVAGVAAFELLYGPRAEFAVGVHEEDAVLVRRLLESLADAARVLGVRTLWAPISAVQHVLGRTVGAGRYVADALHIDVEDAGGSGASPGTWPRP